MRPLQRVIQPFRTLCTQPLFYLLLVLIGPLMLALHWTAIRFPIFYPDYTHASLFEAEPDRLAVIFEPCGERTYWGGVGTERARAWLLDVQAETLQPLTCPPEIGEHWSLPLGLDLNRNLVFQNKLREIVGWNARTGVAYKLRPLPHEPKLINSRYLACTTRCDPGNEFVWYDLKKPETPARSLPIISLHTDIVPINGTNSFYFVLPADNSYESELQMNSGMGTVGESEDEMSQPYDYSGEWRNDDGGIEYELPPVVVNPNAIQPTSTAVLMTMTEQGPKELARWPIVSDSQSEIQQTSGHVISLSIDGKSLESRDAQTGMIVSRIPVPAAALKMGTTATATPQMRFEYWRTLGPFIDFDDGTGTRVAFDIRSGQQLDPPPQPYATSALLLLDQHENESLFLSIQNLMDWIGMIQVRDNNQLLHEWRPPTLAYSSDSIHFSEDGNAVVFYTTDLRVMFVEKATGKVLRHIQPRFWLPWIATALVGLTLCWLTLWIKVSARSRVSIWIDFLVFLSVAFSFLYWRLTLAGTPYDWHRIASACIAGRTVGTAMLIVHQTLFRNTRMLFRCAPIAVMTVCGIFVYWKWFERDHPANVLFGLLILSLIILGSLVIHFMFFRKPHRERSAVSQKHLTLIELFAWTAITALMLAPLNLYDRDDWLRAVSQVASADALISASLIVTVALLAFYLTADRCHLAFRLFGFCLLAIATAITTAYRLNAIDLNASIVGILTFDAVAIPCESLLFLVLGSAYVALPIALRRQFP